MAIETDSFFTDRVNSLLLTTSWVETVKHQLGIQAASQIWGDRPAWYLWLSGASATYQLQWVGGDPGDGPRGAASGIFAVKCYPFADRAVFKTFSAAEQRLIGGPRFDETHTPAFDHRETIPDDLFNVAVIDYTVDRRDRWSCISLESLDTLRMVSRHGDSETIERSVPGWRLGLPMFDRLLGMIAFHGRKAPRRIRLVRSAGFAYATQGTTPPVIEPAPDVHAYTATVLFGSRQDGASKDFSPPDIALLSAGETEPAEVLFDATFSAGAWSESDRSSQAAIAATFPVNPLWWSLAEAEHRSDLGSTCGCGGHHHHGILDEVPLK